MFQEICHSAILELLKAPVIGKSTNVFSKLPPSNVLDYDEPYKYFEMKEDGFRTSKLDGSETFFTGFFENWQLSIALSNTSRYSALGEIDWSTGDAYSSWVPDAISAMCAGSVMHAPLLILYRIYDTNHCSISSFVYQQKCPLCNSSLFILCNLL